MSPRRKGAESSLLSVRSQSLSRARLSLSHIDLSVCKCDVTNATLQMRRYSGNERRRRQISFLDVVGMRRYTVNTLLSPSLVSSSFLPFLFFIVVFANVVNYSSIVTELFFFLLRLFFFYKNVIFWARLRKEIATYKLTTCS